MNPILSPWFWAVVCVIALAVAFILWEMRHATPDPDEAELSAEWLAILRAMNDSPDTDKPDTHHHLCRKSFTSSVGVTWTCSCPAHNDDKDAS